MSDMVAGLGRQIWVNCLIGLGLALLAVSAPRALAAEPFLDAAAAFKLSARALDDKRIELQFGVVPGYHLYRERFSVATVPTSVRIGKLEIPKGKVEFDLASEKDVEVFRQAVTLELELAQVPTSAFKLVVGNQGCADKGLCYPPMQRALQVEPPINGLLVLKPLPEEHANQSGDLSLAAIAILAPVAEAADKAGSGEELGGFTKALRSHSMLKVAGVFLLAGLLLSFTPCVLPMLPILSSIIVGQKGAVSRARGFSLAVAYSLGMALVYTAFGVAAGLAGEGLAAALQNPWVLGAFALLLAGLSLSMFGMYELQVPASIQHCLTQWSGRLQGGEHVGVFAMGGISALIVGPCIAAPLAGALVYISQTRDVVLGGTALFSLASGMSAPLLLIGLSAGSLLPRAGGWMLRVKHFFGFVLLAVALWMVSPVMPQWAMMLGVGALCLVIALYLGAFEGIAKGGATPRRALTRGAGLMFAVLAALQLAGSASGGRDLLRPLQQLVLGTAGRSNAPNSDKTLKFQTVSSVAALDAAVQASNRPVMVDFYADWCVACKELETLTFGNETVRQRMSELTLLRVDVTKNNSDDQALMRKYGLFGPPAVLFFHPAGEEIGPARVIGFQNAEEFREHLDRIDAMDGVGVSLN